MNGKVTEVMKKHLLFLGLSYALLSACGTPVSLTENYFEDENYYNPALPSPHFSAASIPNTPSPPNADLDFDRYWSQDNDRVTEDQFNQGIRGGMNNGFGAMPPYPLAGTSFWQWRLMQQHFMFNSNSWNNPYYGNSMWHDPWNPYGNAWGMGYVNNWNHLWYPLGNYGWYDPWNPYGFGLGYGNGYGYGSNPVWTNSSNNGWSNGSTTTRSGTNYGGRRPSKYNKATGSSSSSGRTAGSTATPTEGSGWGGVLTPVRELFKGNIDQNSKEQTLPPRNKIQRLDRTAPERTPATLNNENTPAAPQKVRKRVRSSYDSYERISPSPTSPSIRSHSPVQRTAPQREVSTPRSPGTQRGATPQRSTGNTSTNARRR